MTRLVARLTLISLLTLSACSEEESLGAANVDVLVLPFAWV